MALSISCSLVENSPSTSLFEDYTPNSSAGESSEAEEECCYCFLCHGEIVERSTSCEGDPAVFCEGRHQQWAHASCAGVCEVRYEAMSSSSEPWLCQQCVKIAECNGDAQDEGVKLVPKMSEPFIAADTSPNAFEEDTEESDQESLAGEQEVNATVPPESEDASLHVSTGSPDEDTTNPGEKAVLLHRISALEKELQAVHQQLLDEKARAAREARRWLESIAELEARINAVELCQGISDSSTAKSESQIRKKAKKTKKRNRGKSRQTSVCNTEPTTATQESNVDSGPIRSIESSQDQESRQDQDSTPDQGSNLVQEPSCNRIDPSPLFKSPTVRYVWGVPHAATPDDVCAAITSLGVNPEAFKVERREVRKHHKKVWYFAVLADEATVADISANWSNLSKSWKFDKPQTQSGSFLYHGALPKHRPYHNTQPSFHHHPHLFSHPLTQPHVYPHPVFVPHQPPCPLLYHPLTQTHPQIRSTNNLIQQGEQKVQNSQRFHLTPPIQVSQGMKGLLGVPPLGWMPSA